MGVDDHPLPASFARCRLFARKMGVDDHPLLATTACLPPLPPTPLAQHANRLRAAASAMQASVLIMSVQGGPDALNVISTASHVGRWVHPRAG